MVDRRALNAQCQRRRRANLAIREEGNERNRKSHRRRRADPAIREEENERNREHNRGSHRRRRADLAIREEENERNRESHRQRRADPAIREEENERNREHNCESHRRGRADPAIREEENERNRGSHRRRRADPAIREMENMQRAVIRSNVVVHMACKYVNGEYIFNQPCGEWNVLCKHGCGYYHLSSSTPGTRKKCCANGRLSSLSDEFDEELTVRYDLDPFPDFMQRIVFNKTDFTLKSSTYNNLVAMAATVVCNYRNTNGFT